MGDIHYYTWCQIEPELTETFYLSAYTVSWQSVKNTDYFKKIDRGPDNIKRHIWGPNWGPNNQIVNNNH